MNQLFLAYMDLGQNQNAVKVLQKLPDNQNPKFHQLALGVANQADHKFLQAKHQFLQLWHSAHEQQAAAFVDRVLIVNEFDLPTKNRLRSFYQEYVNLKK